VFLYTSLCFIIHILPLVRHHEHRLLDSSSSSASAASILAKCGRVHDAVSSDAVLSTLLYGGQNAAEQGPSPQSTTTWLLVCYTTFSFLVGNSSQPDNWHYTSTTWLTDRMHTTKWVRTMLWLQREQNVTNDNLKYDLPVFGTDNQHGPLIVGATTQHLSIQTANLFWFIFKNLLLTLQQWSKNTAAESEYNSNET